MFALVYYPSVFAVARSQEKHRRQDRTIKQTLYVKMSGNASRPPSNIVERLRRSQALVCLPLLDLSTGKVNIKSPITGCAAMWIKPKSAHDVALDNSPCMRAINLRASTMGTSAAGTGRSGVRVIGRRERNSRHRDSPRLSVRQRDGRQTSDTNSRSMRWDE